MSVNTPPGSTGSPAPASPANNVATEQQNNAIADRMVLDYLRARGHAAAEKALANAVEAASPEDKGKQPETLTSEDLVKALAVFAQSHLDQAKMFSRILQVFLPNSRHWETHPVFRT